MHILFVHKNFPAQFGHIARDLIKQKGWECSFVCEKTDANIDGIRRIKYKTKGGATARTHYLSRSFENYIWHSHAVYEALQAHPEIKPDLIVGHSGFGSTVFLADLYRAPIINYFEYYYHATGTDMDFRPEFPSSSLNILRARSRNAMLLLDLMTCQAAYSPTHWQRDRFPQEFREKIEVIFDGIDTKLWHRRTGDSSACRRIGERDIPAEIKIVTYVSRGFESMRGFDIFMKVAHRLTQTRKDVVFACVGSDRVCYGGDETHIGTKSFRDHVLALDNYDLSRFIFTGAITPDELAQLLRISDLHIYLTVPFVLSWSLMNAMACGCTVLASATPPVQEVIRAGENGLLADFYDVDRFVEIAHGVLDHPSVYRSLGAKAAETIEREYALSAVLPKMAAFFERVANRERARDDRA